MSKEIRHRISRNSSGNIPSPIEQKDWSMEDAVEFPSRSQIRTWVREEFYNRWRNIGLQYTGDGTSTGTVATGANQSGTTSVSQIQAVGDKQFIQVYSQAGANANNAEIGTVKLLVAIQYAGMGEPIKI